MVRNSIAWVQVRCLEGDFFSIEFGGFALTIFKDFGKLAVTAYPKEDFEKRYWEFLENLHGLPCSCESRNINPDDFKKFQRIIEGKYHPTSRQYLDLLAKVFPDCMAILAD